MNDERVSALEFRVAYQEDILQTLSDELAKQHVEIKACHQKIKLLTDEVLRLREGDGEASEQDFTPPPHY